MIKMKRGDWFEFGGQIIAQDGSSIGTDFTGWSIKSQVRCNGGLVKELAATWIDATQGLYALVGGDTTEWPIGRSVFDVQITDPSGRRYSTNTEILELEWDPTHG
ncbi:hypothetical protein AB4120_14820 [Cupriavidus sp. 2KB_3]|uniref:hypothetical protein n=1 Tax=Cupriavidus sp. 2KB_3 TaxID=3232980 RepID=UPI003F8F50C1